MTSTPTYLKFTGGIRSVKPYVYTHKVKAKGRWLNKQILSVLCSEFSSYTLTYWKEAIKIGLVTVNGVKVSETYQLKNGDQLLHRVHKHEPSVVGDVQWIGETGTCLYL